MERYTLKTLYPDISDLSTPLASKISTSGLVMGLTGSAFTEVVNFIVSCIYGYFYDDVVAYKGEDPEDVQDVFESRLSYDISVKMPYWYKKYQMIKKLLTTEDMSLLQTSKMVSSSNDTTKSAGGSLQKGATTPTGVSAGSSEDQIDITIGSGQHAGENKVDTQGFVDKYTNHQQKFANASQVEGSRSGTITREGSIDDLLNVLEKLPSSFADEVNVVLQKHFIFDYDGLDKQLY